MRHARSVIGALLFLAAIAPAAAQQVPPDTVSTPEQRALQRLRELSAVGEPDTLRTPNDTIRAQQVRVTGAATGQAAPPSGIERDSIMRMLVTVPDYVVTEYQSENARFVADSSRLELRGASQVAREGSQLVADSLIVYDERLAQACGYGQPVLHGAGMTHPMVTDSVCYNVGRQLGWARGAETTFEEGATWHLKGEVLVFLGDDLYSHRAIFSDCDEPFPHKHYHFGAGQVKVVRDNVLVARDVTLNFQDVPVFWLPFMVQSLSRGRRSGLLMPRFGFGDIARTSTRYSRRIEDVGVYWAVSEYLGAQLALDWFSDNWTGLRGSFDYNFADRFLRGGLTYSQFWKQEGGRDFTLSSQNSWQIDERTSVSLNANYTTSSVFVRERTFDPRELNRSIDSHGSVRRRFDWGNLSLGASRRQFLHNNDVNLKLPSMQLSFSPVTLFEALPGEESWYSNANWQGGFDVNMDRQDVGDLNVNPQSQSTRTLTTGARSSFTVGRFSLSQNFSFDDRQRFERTIAADTARDEVIVPGSAAQTGRWGTSLNFQQRLIGTSTLTPGVSLGGEFQRSPLTDNELVSAPMRVDFNAALRTEIYGFWPGIGPFERFRHRVSPNFSYSYSPALNADSLQRRVFSVAGVREQNRVSMGISQTFEGRRRPQVTETRPETPATPARGGATGAGEAGDPEQPEVQQQAPQDAAQPDTATGPRRREQVAPVSLVSISTDVIAYDFVQARDGYGLVTTQLSNSIQSELLRGLQLSITHDLFRPEMTLPADTLAGTQPVTVPREFAPHLSRVNTSFSLNSDSWIFRLLRLGRGDAPDQDTAGREQEGMPGYDDEDPMMGGPPVDRSQTEYGMIGTGRRVTSTQRGPVGVWSASFNYSLDRPRDPAQRGNQMITSNFTYQPTENWGLRWSTGYSFTTGQFTDHILSLSRTLHDWDANFDFVKAQNGNFTFQFRVALRANPDIKLEHLQRDAQGITRAQERVPR
jgi:hypothetical protein